MFTIYSTIVGFIFIFFDITTMDTIVKLAIVIAILFIIVATTFIINYLSAKKIEINLSNNTKLNVYYGDLFSEKGNIVIPVSECFDMVVDEKFVSSKTTHGHFVNNVFGSNIEELKEKINDCLTNVLPYDESNKNRKKYDLGTTIVIEKNGNRYFLVVLTKFNDKDKAFCTIEDYYIVINRLLDYLHNYSQGEAIYLPLIGGGLSNVNMSKKDLINSLIIAMKSNNNFKAIGDINLVLHNSLKNDINLSDIKYSHR